MADTKNTTKKAVIAMSGGVDSSVAALLMKNKGYECIGVTLKLFNDDDINRCNERTCCSFDDVQDAKQVAYALGIPHYVFNFSDEFKDTVIKRFVDSYLKGATPNPCIDCNRFIKFQKLIHRTIEIGFDVMATGHYARIEYDSGSKRYLLKKAFDKTKEQSYVLYAMTQEQLARTEFPLGELTKDEVRRIAEENGFVNAKKRDSQDICFVPDSDYAAFIEGYTGIKSPKGYFVDENGNILGEHNGIIRYTIGQRKGLGLSLKKPMYVCDKDPVTNTVKLCENSGLFEKELTASDINLIACDSIQGRVRLTAKIRYKHPEQPCFVEQIGEDKLHVVFDEPQRAITKGQALVLYDGDTVVGGGTVD
ncbi:MAG TPA: tRNA 2-thiouridine(34) synthase MnmA [Clostridiales bacterium]|nr:tRNA 2-thiouridine(34) synthase MnmA [Clostridiales bacterium]